MATVKVADELTAIDRQKVVQALETQIGVVKRRINNEKSAEIKGILQADVSHLIDLSRRFTL